MTNVEKLLAEWERDEREGHPVGEQGIPIETAVRMLRAAIEADREGRQDGWDECWVRRGHVTGVLHLANKDDPRAVRILVPASPEPDKETPRVRLLDLGDDAGYTGRGPWNAGG